MLLYIFWALTGSLRHGKRLKLCQTLRFADDVCGGSVTSSIVTSQAHILSWPTFLMMTSSNGNIFRITGPLCGEFTGPSEVPTQRPVTWRFDVFLDLRLNKRLSKQPRGWWFETPSWSLWRQCNVKYLPLTHICGMRFWCRSKIDYSSLIVGTYYGLITTDRMRINAYNSFPKPSVNTLLAKITLYY